VGQNLLNRPRQDQSYGMHSNQRPPWWSVDLRMLKKNLLLLRAMQNIWLSLFHFLLFGVMDKFYNLIKRLFRRVSHEDFRIGAAISGIVGHLFLVGMESLRG